MSCHAELVTWGLFWSWGGSPTVNMEQGLTAVCQPEGEQSTVAMCRGNAQGSCQPARPGVISVCSGDRMEPGAIARQHELCATGFLFNLCSRTCTCPLWLVNSPSACPLPTLQGPCTSCSEPPCKVLLLQMFPCLPTQLPLVEWGFFDCILFVCLFVCLDVWVLLPLFKCLFYLSPKQLVLFRS